MALFQRCFPKTMNLQAAVRFFSRTRKDNRIKKSVFISQSTDVYTNLALEEWLYKNFNFRNHHVMLLCQNDPCVVISQSQNPWFETNFNDFQSLTDNKATLARRNSSGGASYQDEGSLSLTFFTPTNRHDPKYNMDVVARSIFREFGCKVDTDSEANLVMRSNKQLSMTSQKQGENNSYHNLSLMIRANKLNRDIALRKNHGNMKTDFQSPLPTEQSVMNLCEEHPQVTVPAVVKAVGWEYLRTAPLKVVDGGMSLARNQKGFHMINPTESWFPGLNEIRDGLTTWDWCYGATPKFSVSQTFRVPGKLVSENDAAPANLKVNMDVEKGKIADIMLYVPYELSSYGINSEATVIRNLKGKNFSVRAFENIQDSLGGLLDEKDIFLTQCLKQVMSCA